MKNYVFFGILMVLLCTSAVNAQNYDRFEKIANELTKQADELVNRTSNSAKKENSNSRSDIEQAFLAEQLYASSKLMERLIDDKYRIEDLRYAGNVLLKISGQLPTNSSYNNEWRKLADSINLLNRELQIPIGEKIETPKNTDESKVLGRVFWTGMVDAKVHLVIRGGSLSTRTISGTTYPDGIPSFTKILPRQGNYSVGVKKKTGRGDVSVIQQPDRSNNYTAIVEIVDEGGGAKSYTVEVFWY